MAANGCDAATLEESRADASHASQLPRLNMQVGCVKATFIRITISNAQFSAHVYISFIT